MTWKDGTTTVASWTYSYDGAGRVTSVVNSFSETTDFTYDDTGKILTQSNQNGTSREYEYNHARSWPTVIRYKNGSTTTEEYELTYDGGSNTIGNITRVDELSGDYVTYTYDALYRLTAETRTGTPSYSRTYGYDLAGNPTTINSTTIASFDDGNKLSTFDGQSVSHDVDGNLTSIASTSPVTFSDIDWHELNWAEEVTATAGDTIDYGYLPSGHRSWSQASTGMTDDVFYIFHGDLLLGEITGTTPSVAYTLGPDGIVSKRNLTSSISYWYEFGPQGETRALTDSYGSVTDSYYYNAYGEVISSSGSTTNPYKYGGKYGYYSESLTGLILATHRWYSPELMRWLSRDPIGYDGGVNLYEYVGGSPVRYVDPDGLAPFFNNSPKKVPYKHEKRWANRKLYCPPFTRCEVDGVFPNGWKHPPVKIKGGCACKTSDGKTFDTVCFRLIDLLGYPRIFNEWKDVGFENWNPDFDVHDSQDNEWREYMK